MNGVTFFLVVNFVVAVSFGVVFVVVAKRSQSRVAANWIGAGFLVASLSALCELLVAHLGPPRFWALSAFLAVLCGMVMLTVGIGHMYSQLIDRRITVLFIGASALLAYLIYDLPRGTPLHAILYQGPFAVVVLVSALIVLFTRQYTLMDRFLGLLLLVTSLHFVAKASLAVVLGAGVTARDYIHTNYALISQSLTAILMVAIGLALLAKLVLEILAVHKTESEIDSLSGLPNRRGFDRQVQSRLRDHPEGSHAIILCDLDHFKRINDTFGHHVGDLVITAFGERLRRHAPAGSVLGRIGGEEFIVFLCRTGVDEAVRLAQLLRQSAMSLPDLPPALKVTASFGVATVAGQSDLVGAYRSADHALYEAKGAGRNRVKLATSAEASVA